MSIVSTPNYSFLSHLRTTIEAHSPCQQYMLHGWVSRFLVLRETFVWCSQKAQEYVHENCDAVAFLIETALRDSFMFSHELMCFKLWARSYMLDLLPISWGIKNNLKVCIWRDCILLSCGSACCCVVELLGSNRWVVVVCGLLKLYLAGKSCNWNKIPL